MQEQLREVYEELRMEAVNVWERLSSPLIPWAFPEWLGSKHRVMCFGQETRDWGVDCTFHWRSAGDCLASRQPTSCRSCKYEPMSAFGEFVRRPDSIEALEHAYQVFDMGTNQNKFREEDGRVISRSQFWRTVHTLRLNVEGQGNSRQILWGNISFSDFEGRSALRIREGIKDYRRLSQRVLESQIRVLRPKAIVFFVGPAWLERLREFPQLEFEKLPEGSGRQWLRAVDVPEYFPPSTIWSLHPRALQQRGLLAAAVEEISMWIGGK